MFTGLIECTGVLRGAGGGKLRVLPKIHWRDLRRGESIAVNGCCLTLETVSPSGELEFHTLEESLRRTNLGILPVGAPLNLERALRLGDRLGGHIVQGHVDTASAVLELKKLPDGDPEMLIQLPRSDVELVMEKGSIAVDGVSLTVVEAANDFFGVRLIPVTLQETALAARGAGSLVNLEYDVIGRYVLRHFSCGGDTASTRGGITMDTLHDAGFF